VLKGIVQTTLLINLLIDLSSCHSKLVQLPSFPLSIFFSLQWNEKFVEYITPNLLEQHKTTRSFWVN